MPATSLPLPPRCFLGLLSLNGGRTCQGAEGRKENFPDLLGSPCLGRREEVADFLAGKDSEAGVMPSSVLFPGNSWVTKQSLVRAFWTQPNVSKFLEIPDF